jgi:hypothetical protein
LETHKYHEFKELQNEIEISNFLIDQNNTILGQLIGIACYTRILQFLSEFIDMIPSKCIEEINTPYIFPKYDIWESIVQYRFHRAINTIQVFFLKNDPNYVIANLVNDLKFKMEFKYNRVVNSNYIQLKKDLDLSQLSAHEFYQRTKNFKEYDFNIPFYERYFNSRGFVMMGTTHSICLGYLSPYHNLNGYINMLKLKMMIKQKNISATEIPEFLEAQSDSLFNPYTEEAIKWDAENSKLYFEGPLEDDDYMREMNIKF